MPRRRAQNGHQWRKIYNRKRREVDVCEMPVCLCPSGRLINKELSAPDPWSFSVDHIEEVWRRPDLEYVYENTRAAHRHCNRMREAPKGVPSVDW